MILDFKKMHLVTAIIPTYNEEKNIEAAIKSVLWADEIIVVDSFSTDRTLEIAKKYPVTIYEHEYVNSATQKNWIIPQAKHGWIFLLDADEEASDELIAEVKKTIQLKDACDAYWIPRINKYMGKWVKYSGWQNDAVIRLFKRDTCKYQDKHVHSEVETTGKVGRLKYKIKHDAYKDFAVILKKIDTYSSWKAYDRRRKTKKVTAFHLVAKPAFKFFKHYIMKLGFMDGRVGFIISSLSAYDVFIRAVKMWRIEEGEIFKQNR